MTVREKIGMAIIWAVILRFLAHELHTAWLIHLHQSRRPEPVECVLRLTTCKDCRHYEAVGQASVESVCKLRGFVNRKELCEGFEERLPEIAVCDGQANR